MCVPCVHTYEHKNMMVRRYEHVCDIFVFIIWTLNSDHIVWPYLNRNESKIFGQHWKYIHYTETRSVWCLALWQPRHLFLYLFLFQILSINSIVYSFGFWFWTAPILQLYFIHLLHNFTYLYTIEAYRNTWHYSFNWFNCNFCGMKNRAIAKRYRLRNLISNQFWRFGLEQA